jgi:hypothetical protein
MATTAVIDIKRMNLRFIVNGVKVWLGHRCEARPSAAASRAEKSNASGLEICP